MKKLLVILTFINLIGLIAGGFVLYEIGKNQEDIFGAITIPKAVALFETSLASSVTGSATSMTLATGTDKESTSLSGTYGFVIDEGSANEEFVLCSASGTALTSCSRGLSVTAPASASAALQKTHRRGASVKITDYPLIGVFQRLLNGTDKFPNILLYDSPPTFTSSASLISKKYADDLAIAGAPDASETVKGISELATVAEVNAGTGLGATSARLFVNPSYLASSNYGLNIPTAGQKAALAGSSGTPGASNLYITQNDVSSSSFSDASDKVIRSDGDAVPSNLWIDIAKLNIAASAAGDILYRTGSAFTRLPIGNNGFILTASTSTGTAEVVWASPSNTRFGGDNSRQVCASAVCFSKAVPANSMGANGAIKGWALVSDEGGTATAIDLNFGGTLFCTVSIDNTTVEQQVFFYLGNKGSLGTIVGSCSTFDDTATVTSDIDFARASVSQTVNQTLSVDIDEATGATIEYIHFEIFKSD